jgi:hypothetical protein
LNATQFPVAANGAGTFVTAGSGFLPGVLPPLAAGQANVFSLNTSLILEIWDFDVTQQFRLGAFDLTAGAGIRYMHMSQGFRGSAIQTGLPAGVIDNAVESSFNNTNSGGISLLLEARLPLGAGGWSLYANARAGLLFGERHATLFTSTVTNPGGAVPNVTTPFSNIGTTSDFTMPFAELELGVEWTRRYDRFTPFVRVGFEGRDYINAGNAQYIALTASRNGDVGLFGVAFHVGADY